MAFKLVNLTLIVSFQVTLASGLSTTSILFAVHFLCSNAFVMLVFWVCCRLTDLGFDPNIDYQQEGRLQLLGRLIVPALLLVAVMLQLHIFHNKFMKVTDYHYL